MAYRKKSNLSTPLLLILVLILGFTWLRPKLAEFQEKQDTLSRLQTELQETSTQIQLDTPLIDLTATDREFLDNSIPQGFDQDFLIDTIRKIAEDNQLSEITNISFQRSSAETTQQIKAVQISINGRTTYPRLETFIEDLENNSRFFNIQSLSTTLNEVENRVESTFSIQLESYYS